MANKILAQEDLKKELDYDPETGVFLWKSSARGRRKNKIAGSLRKKDGYIFIRINKILFSAHRLAWIYMNGHIDQSLVIDHINGKTSDNRLCNLRMVTHKENSLNQYFHRGESRKEKNGGRSRLSVFLDS